MVARPSLLVWMNWPRTLPDALQILRERGRRLIDVSVGLNVPPIFANAFFSRYSKRERKKKTPRERKKSREKAVLGVRPKKERKRGRERRQREGESRERAGAERRKELLGVDRAAKNKKTKSTRVARRVKRFLLSTRQTGRQLLRRFCNLSFFFFLF